MPRTASAALLAHMSSPSQTVAYLLKVGPLPDDSYLTFASIGRDVAYNDGFGERNYYARTGTQLANLASTNDLSTDNTEAQTLQEVAEYPGQGVTEAMIDNGDLDDIEFVIYVMNFMDHSMGHMELQSGRVGKVRMQIGGLVTIELRSWTDLLRQNEVVERWALNCRVKEFGSQPGDERFPCMKDITGLWVNDVVVTHQGAENVRDFRATGLAQATGYFKPGLVHFTDGANAGRKVKVESFTSGGFISLQFIVRHPIQVGDVFDIRPDCTREWGRRVIGDPIQVNSCLHHSNEEWFRGEWTMPAADSIGLTIPGAANGGFE